MEIYHLGVQTTFYNIIRNIMMHISLAGVRTFLQDTPE